MVPSFPLVLSKPTHLDQELVSEATPATAMGGSASTDAWLPGEMPSGEFASGGVDM